MLAGSTIASATFFLSGSNFELTFAVAMIPPALALAWMTYHFGDELWGHRKGTSEAHLRSSSKRIHMLRAIDSGLLLHP